MKVKQCEKGEAEMKLKETKKAKIGIYTMGLKAYWAQFAGLHERMMEYGNFIAEKIEKMDVEVFFYGLVDCEEEGRKCGEYFNGKGVDLIFAHAGTYVTSASVLPPITVAVVIPGSCSRGLRLSMTNLFQSI